MYFFITCVSIYHAQSDMVNYEINIYIISYKSIKIKHEFQIMTRPDFKRMDIFIIYLKSPLCQQKLRMKNKYRTMKGICLETY